jgi:hypothetical protein
MKKNVMINLKYRFFQWVAGLASQRASRRWLLKRAKNVGVKSKP